jgi:hypothetical protein
MVLHVGARLERGQPLSEASLVGMPLPRKGQVEQADFDVRKGGQTGGLRPSFSEILKYGSISSENSE